LNFNITPNHILAVVRAFVLAACLANPIAHATATLGLNEKRVVIGQRRRQQGDVWLARAGQRRQGQSQDRGEVRYDTRPSAEEIRIQPAPCS